jgi:hypothetical protein
VLVRGPQGILRAIGDTERALIEAELAQREDAELDHLARKARHRVAQTAAPFTNKAALVSSLGKKATLGRRAIDRALERGWLVKTGDRFEVGADPSEVSA